MCKNILYSWDHFLSVLISTMNDDAICHMIIMTSSCFVLPFSYWKSFRSSRSAWHCHWHAAAGVGNDVYLKSGRFEWHPGVSYVGRDGFGKTSSLPWTPWRSPWGFILLLLWSLTAVPTRGLDNYWRLKVSRTEYKEDSTRGAELSNND